MLGVSSFPSRRVAWLVVMKPTCVLFRDAARENDAGNASVRKGSHGRVHIPSDTNLIAAPPASGLTIPSLPITLSRNFTGGRSGTRFQRVSLRLAVRRR